MQYMVLIAAFLLKAVTSPAPEIAVKRELLANDQFRLEFTRIRENSARPQQNGKSRTLVDVRVISATPQGFEVDWIPGETILDNPQVAKDPLVAAAFDAVRG